MGLSIKWHGLIPFSVEKPSFLNQRFPRSERHYLYLINMARLEKCTQLLLNMAFSLEASPPLKPQCRFKQCWWQCFNSLSPISTHLDQFGSFLYTDRECTPSTSCGLVFCKISQYSASDYLSKIYKYIEKVIFQLCRASLVGRKLYWT